MIYPVDMFIKGRDLLTIDEDAPVRDALHLMVTDDFGQLPVLNKNGNLHMATKSIPHGKIDS